MEETGISMMPNKLSNKSSISDLPVAFNKVAIVYVIENNW